MQYLGTIDKAKDIINKDFVEKLLGDYQPLINDSSKLPYSLISGVPTSLPASDVYSWAKASTKPSYSYSEITGAISTTELQNYLTQNSYLNVTGGDNRYLQLSGGTLRGGASISWGNANNGLTDTSDWNIKTDGLRILSSITSGSNAPSQYATGLHVVGRYGFQIACEATSSNFYMRNIRDGVNDWCKLWHSSNFNPSNYLPLSGGTLSGNLTIQNKTVDVITLYRDDVNNSPSIKCTNKSDGTLGYIGVSGSGSGIGIQPFFMDSAGTVNKIWHEGNDGSGSGLDADLLDGKHANAFALSNTDIKLDSFVNQIGYGFKSQGWYDSGAAMMFGANSSYYMLLQGASNGSKIYLRANYMFNGSYAGWKDIAFTDSNVASATKLQTARTIWGQSFDGTGNITGQLNITTGTNVSLTYGTGFFTLGSMASNHIAIDTNDIQAKSNGTTASTLYINDYGGNVSMCGNSGNVGIGTTSPGYKLHVAGTVNFEGSTYIGTTSHALLGLMRGSANYITTPTDGYLVFNMGGTATSAAYSCLELYEKNVIMVRGGGNVGIGTASPAYKLDVNGVAKATSLYADSYVWLAPNSEAIYLNDTAIAWHNSSNAWTDTLILFARASITLNKSTTVNGNILATGGITMYSMRALKNVVDERGLSLSELSTIKPTRYTWKDGRDNRLHFGGIADDIQQVLPEVVYSTCDGILTMDYGNAAFAVASSLIKPVIDHENRIAMLEEENKQLRQEVERLKSA